MVRFPIGERRRVDTGSAESAFERWIGRPEEKGERGQAKLCDDKGLVWKTESCRESERDVEEDKEAREKSPRTGEMLWVRKEWRLGEGEGKVSTQKEKRQEGSPISGARACRLRRGRGVSPLPPYAAVQDLIRRLTVNRGLDQLASL